MSLVLNNNVMSMITRIISFIVTQRSSTAFKAQRIPSQRFERAKGCQITKMKTGDVKVVQWFGVWKELDTTRLYVCVDIYGGLSSKIGSTMLVERWRNDAGDNGGGGCCRGDC
jgi:hypothetical protein